MFLSHDDYLVTVLWNTPVGCPVDEEDTHKTCVITSQNGVMYENMIEIVYYFCKSMVKSNDTYCVIMKVVVL